MWRSHSAKTGEPGAVVFCRPVGCILSPVCVIILTNSINIHRFYFLLTLQMDSFMKQRDECCVPHMQSAGFELFFDLVMTEPVRIRGLWTAVTWPSSKQSCRAMTVSQNAGLNFALTSVGFICRQMCAWVCKASIWGMKGILSWLLEASVPPTVNEGNKCWMKKYHT